MRSFETFCDLLYIFKALILVKTKSEYFPNDIQLVYFKYPYFSNFHYFELDDSFFLVEDCSRGSGLT